MPGQQQEKAFISQSGFYKESLCSSVLSSTTAITDANGSLSQHVLYFAYGETFVDEHRNSTNSPYLFNGKEYDEETGRYYYGARYYDPRVSLWIGVDPMAGKYPGVSPYCYTFNNPVKFIDPDGKEPTPQEAIALVKHINSYFNNKKVQLIGGWKLDLNNVYDNRQKSGFTGALYSREKDDGSTEYAFVTRGSDLDFSKANRASTEKDWINNIQQIFNGATEQYIESVDKAIEISNALNDKELTYVGQSLGGGLASANALATGRKGITFNAAGLSDKTVDDLKLNNKNANITAWIIKGEIVDYLQSRVPGLNRAAGQRCLLKPSLPYMPGFFPIQRGIRLYQRVQNHYIEAFEGKFD